MNEELQAKLQALLNYHAETGKPGGPDFVDFFRKFGEIITQNDINALKPAKVDNAKPDSHRSGKPIQG
jgi:hypothetical protein